MQPTAIVMNMFCTGLGIARSLGERGIPVIGLTAQRRAYGNFTRYAQVTHSPDSRNEPEALLSFLLQFGKKIGRPSVIFPTRDDDILFLDRFRSELAEYFVPVIPQSFPLRACLNKWETYLCARRAEVPAPQCWLLENEDDLRRVAHEITFPCVLKPVAAHEWRKAEKWELVGNRKAIGISSQEELLAEYNTVARAEKRVLAQEMVSGPDNCLFVAACYFDRRSNFVAGFNAQKLLQVPEGFGTGCVVQNAHSPELFAPTIRLLQSMRFTGIAEVEYKWDAMRQEYSLIEINPRPWDQHRLGNACGCDLIYLAYCESAGLPMLVMEARFSARKWIAEDVFFVQLLRLLWRRSMEFPSVLRLFRGKRIYGIWSLKDPLPALAYACTVLIPNTVGAAVRAVWREMKRTFSRILASKKEPIYESCLPKTTRGR